MVSFKNAFAVGFEKVENWLLAQSDSKIFAVIKSVRKSMT